MPRLYTKDTDRHMYLNFHSEHPLNLKRSIPYSQFLRLKRIHSESQFLIQSQINLYWFFIWRDYPHELILEAWQKTNKVNRESLLDDTRDKKETKSPLMFITTYNSANPNFREIISKHWSFLGRSSATRELCNQDIMVTYRKPPSLKDMLVRAKIPQPRTGKDKGCTRPNSCQYCTRISQSGRITNLNNHTTYNTITKGTCQSNNLIYCLECKSCHIKYVGQTKNRITDRFQGHIYDIKHNNNTTVVRHFLSHNDQSNPSMIIHILEYIRLPRDVPRSKSIRDNRELVWIHRLNTLIPNGLNILD